ncbi:hypothetical protein [Chrysiogenes arsenatis]|uniref:hypothetical protein n=1 Tax=Chrysiogenes arsenatis TaxID=309797 RepID=UPI000407B931|nr:hypothetical protein [Chrysiogenes arsenatis]
MRIETIIKWENDMLLKRARERLQSELAEISGIYTFSRRIRDIERAAVNHTADFIGTRNLGGIR